MTTNFNWTCPYCARAQVATDRNVHWVSGSFDIGYQEPDKVGIFARGIRCLNQECNKLTLDATLHEVQGASAKPGKVRRQWQLLPESNAIPQPEYIPSPLRDDYYEACRIRDLSPKASATMARRCLQGMIRDFCKIAKGTLDAEIKALAAALNEGKGPPGVTHESVEAIDHVRSIGNIGAHMEKDINLIIDVDPGEAQALIGLAEMLFSEWYIARFHRQQRLEHIANIAAEKKSQIAKGRAERKKD